MTSSTHERLPQRVVLGTDTALESLTTELHELRDPRVLLIASDRVAGSFLDALTPVAHISRVIRHVPAEEAESARRVATDVGAEVVVCIGGGSATGLAKAVALDTALPIIAIPTTFAGSEATPVWGITRDGRKQVGTDRLVLPTTVIYDTALFRDIPADLATASAFNALAHGVDALWAPRADAFTAADAEAGIRLIATALRRPARADDAVTRDLLVGTYLASVAFAAAGSGMHHKICHVLGGTYDLPHAPLHTVILPHVVAFNAAADRGSAAVIARALGGDPDPVEALLELVELVDAPNSLAALGFPEAAVDAAAVLCLQAIPSSNPRPVTRASLQELLTDALSGPPPTRRRAT